MLLHGWRGARRLGRRGAVSIIFACTLPMLAIAVGVGIDFSRIADVRAALQRTVDNAALSGAAGYVLYASGDAYSAVAVSTANAAFCRAAAALPAGATLVASTGAGSAQCGGGPGPAITAVIGGYVPGTRGAAANTGCSATNTVVTGATCGFLVTVTASATVKPTFSGFLGGARTVTATATAANPFLDLGQVLSINLGNGQAWNANSLWVYPLLLDANGNPDFSSDPGARPPRTGCTGAPDQTVCGSYTMLASTFYMGHYSCYTGHQSSSCTTADGSTFGGASPGGVVQNPRVSGAVITATTPIGFALESTSGGNASLGLDVAGGYGTPSNNNPPASSLGPYITASTTSGCKWPAVTTYHTVTQVYPPATTARGTNLGLAPSAALEGRNSNGLIDWTLTTHWFYSSYLANNLPPSYDEVYAQSQGVQQKVQSVSTANPPTSCNDTTSVPTTYPATNCSLYIVRDPSSPVPDPSYAGAWGVNDQTCWAPSSTPGRQYAALSCQGFAGHTFVFAWNDMGGSLPRGDDTNYGDAITTVSCSGSSKVLLIN